jgi:hypothetical protein
MDMHPGEKTMIHNTLYNLKHQLWPKKLNSSLQNTQNTNFGISLAIKIIEFLWPLKFVESQNKSFEKFLSINFTSKTSKINFIKRRKGEDLW